ncbi:MAG: hypothetical protein ACI83W_001191 [Marinoscillum sp.]|jgi:hypothetical protein
MKKVAYHFLFILSIFQVSCGENDHEVKIEFQEYLIFGRYAGYCEGKTCIDIYKLTENTLYVSEDIYPTSLMLYDGGLYDAEFTLLDNLAVYNIEELINNFPNELFTISDTDIGCPDCADQGGYFFEMSTKSYQDNWRVDMDRSVVPT